jgi:FtsH-binding integral membrane protein
MKKSGFLLDLCFLLLFVLIGRHAHKHGESLSGVAATLWPFAVGLFGGWLVALLRFKEAISRRSGLLVVLFTILIGMILRSIVGQGIAATFILVALVFLGIFLLGWRILYARVKKS